MYSIQTPSFILNHFVVNSSKLLTQFTLMNSSFNLPSFNGLTNVNAIAIKVNFKCQSYIHMENM